MVGHARKVLQLQRQQMCSLLYMVCTMLLTGCRARELECSTKMS